MTIQTTVFDLAPRRGFASDRALARAMGISPATISRVRSGEYSISAEFITGAQRAFPDLTLDELFSVSNEEVA